MKLLLALTVLAIIACASAQSTATQLSSGDCNCNNAAANTNSACDNQCGTVVSGSNDGVSSYKEMKERELANLGPRPRVEDAIKPIDEWIQDFSKRTALHGGLWEAAKATVTPLIKKLYKSQQEAIERLKQSNRAIRQHVEDAATEHVYNLLKSKRAIDDAELAAVAKKEQMAEAKEAVTSAKEKEGAAAESAKAMAEMLKKEKAMEAEARQKAGLPASKDNTTNSILDNINKILGSK